MKTINFRAAMAVLLLLPVMLSSCGYDTPKDCGTTPCGAEITEYDSEPETAFIEKGTEADPYGDAFWETAIQEPAVTEEEIYTLGYIESTDGTFMEMDLFTIMQQIIGMPNGCEVVSLCIALRYYGYTPTPEYMFENFMPKGPNNGETNPFEKYIGDPRNSTGYGCYAPCLVETANTYITERIDLGIRAYDISGYSMVDIEYFLQRGHPVILWATLNMEDSEPIGTWEFDGETVNWYAKSHCVVLAGYEDGEYIICDPLKGKVKYPKEAVEKAYRLVYSQAVVFQSVNDDPNK